MLVELPVAPVELPVAPMPPILPMTPPRPGEYGSASLRRERRRQTALRRTWTRSHWWYPFVLATVLVAGVWGLLRVDQFVAHHLVWPVQGARFVEVAPSLGATPVAVVEPRLEDAGLTIVIAGLNRKSGSDIVEALPALRQPGTRIFTLVHGTGISDDDLLEKFDALLAAVQPREVHFFGSSMGGNIALNLARHLEQRRPDTPSPSTTALPTVGYLLLDGTPLDAHDVRERSRTRADALTWMTEALNTEGGAVARVTAEVLAQREQWSTGAFPFLQPRAEDLNFKLQQVMRDKIGRVGISTRLVKEQYGVIRRMRPAELFADLSPATTIGYFLPEDREADRTVDVAQVEAKLTALAERHDLDVRILPIAGAQHASAENQAAAYNAEIARLLASRSAGSGLAS